MPGRALPCGGVLRGVVCADEAAPQRDAPGGERFNLKLLSVNGQLPARQLEPQTGLIVGEDGFIMLDLHPVAALVQAGTTVQLTPAPVRFPNDGLPLSV